MSESLPRRLLARLARRVLLPLLPQGSRLPLLYRLCVLDGSAEPELIHLHRYCGQRGLAIDIGANEGQFAMRLARIFGSVLAFEVNPALTSELVAWGRSRVRIIHQGLSSSSGQATLYIPVLRGLALTGWASLAPGNCPDTSQHLEQAVELVTLDSFELPEVGFMKIDVEGHEVEVLRGAAKTIARNKPTVLIEVKDRNLPAVQGFFRDLGYREYRLQQLIGIAGSRENLVFMDQQ